LLISPISDGQLATISRIAASSSALSGRGKLKRTTCCTVTDCSGGFRYGY